MEEQEIHFTIEDTAIIYEVVTYSTVFKAIEPIQKECRYCGNTNQKEFKKIAHLLPEFTGNKDLFFFEECDNCNSLFGKYETALNAFGGVQNVLLPIKGKKGYRKFKDNKSGNSLQHRDGKLRASIKEKQDNFLVFDDKNLQINSTTESYKRLYVYKCLVKFAISFLDKNELHKFDKTIKWLLEPDMMIEPKLPLGIVYNNKKPLIKPLAILLKKKTDTNCTEYSFTFNYGFHSFQIYLPYNTADEDLNYDNIELPLMYAALFTDDNFKFKWYDMNDIEKTNHIEKLNLNANLKRYNFEEIMIPIKEELDEIYLKYKNNKVVKKDNFFAEKLASGEIDATISEFNTVIRGIIQENIGELTNFQIETVTEYANNIMDNFERIAKKQNQK